jgi:rhamnogalacturonan endolyase
LYLQYATDFPNDVNYTIGQSDFRKDWYFEQVPHWDGVEKVTADRSAQVLAAAASRPEITDPAARAAANTRLRVAAANAAAGTNYSGRASPWNINFDLPEAPHGKATLRVAFCGSGGAATITMNGKTAANMLRTNFTRSIGWDGIQSVWQERDIAFDASLMQAGKNVLTLTIPAGNPSNGIMYDYLRLELDESAPAPPPPGPEPARGGFGGGGGFGG